MTTTIFPYNQTGIVSIGAYDSGTAWSGGTGGNRLSANLPQIFDFLITGVTAVGSGGYYYGGTASLLTFTLMDTSGNVLNTTNASSTSPAMTSGGFQNTSVNLFPTYSMSASTTYWVRITNTMGGSGILQANNLVQLTGPTSPTVVSTPPTNYGSVYTFGTGGGTNILTNVGLEGSLLGQAFGSYTVLKSVTAGMGTTAENAMVRFKATCATMSVMLYPGGTSNIHLNRLADTGTTGIGTASGDATSPASGYTWQLLSGSLDSANEYIYEVSTGGNAGTIIYGIMTTGGTGINTSITGSTLVRPLLLAAIGDSHVSQVNGTGGQNGNVLGNPYVGSLALLGQNTNKQILNVGVPGQNLSAMVARYTDITGYGTNPSAVLIDGGINDIKSGSPPTPTALVGYMASLINNIRAVGGYWATVPIYYELIKPADTSWVSGGHTYIDTYNTPMAALAGQYAAGTAPGQVGSSDTNVHCIDTRTWNLAGSGWETGSAFVETLYFDGIHLNSSLSSPPGLGYQTEFGFLNGIFGNPATAITLTNSVPAAGAPSRISPQFTAALSPTGGILTGTNTLTISDGGAGGTFTPSSPVLTGSIPSVTFQYTASATAGPRSVTISLTNTGTVTTLANPSPVTYTVMAETVSYSESFVSFSIVGTASNWTGTPFSMVGGGGATIYAQTVTNTTQATITIVPNSTTGPWTITDGTATFSLSQGGSGGTVSIFNSSILGKG